MAHFYFNFYRDVNATPDSFQISVPNIPPSWGENWWFDGPHMTDSHREYYFVISTPNAGFRAVSTFGILQ
jgi:hypothetical protein